MKKIIFLAGIICSFSICYSDQSGSLTVSPGSDVSWTCVLEPYETANLTISIASAPPGYRLTSTKVNITSSHPGCFIWGGGYSVVNSAVISATTCVKVSCVWEPVSGGGSGPGPRPPNLYGSATGTAVAEPGEYWNAANASEIPVGGQTTVNAYKNQGEDAPSSWSVSGPANISGNGASAAVTGTGACQHENEVIVTSTCNDCGQSDTEYLTVVAVTEIEADPEIVCVGGSVSYKITTQPEGFDSMVEYNEADTSAAGVHEVLAECGTSSAETEVTVVEVDSISCGGVTSTTSEPGESETLYIYVGEPDDTVIITASLNPAVDAENLSEGCPAWQNAEPLAENPLSAEFPIGEPSGSAEGDIVRATCGDSEVALKIVVLEIDLAYDGLPEETEDPPNEEDPGGYIMVNCNDNAGGENPGEGNGVMDVNDDTPLLNPDPDLKPVTLTLLPNNLEYGKVTFNVPGALKVWSDTEKNEPPGKVTDSLLEWNFPEDEMPSTLYLEGYSPGSGQLTLTYEGKITCSDAVNMTAIRVSAIDATSPLAGMSGNPPPFEGHKPWPFDSSKIPPDKHMVVFYNDVIDSSFNVQDFDATLTANIQPSSISADILNELWSKISGPNSGGFDQTDTFEVKYQNPKQGGVYRFDFDLGISGCAKSEANVVLPLSGAEVSSIVGADLARADAFATIANSKYPTKAEKLLRMPFWFWSDGNGDYLGRPNNFLSRTCVHYNQMNPSTGMGAVCTWFGTSVLVAKLSNFMYAYAARKLGFTLNEIEAGGAFGTADDDATLRCYYLGWMIANGATYSSQIPPNMPYIWENSDSEEHKIVWPNFGAHNYDWFFSPGFLDLSTTDI